MSSVSSTRHLEDDAETPEKSFIFDASIIPQNTATCSVSTVSTSECLTKSNIQPIEGKAAFKIQLEILKANHDGFEFRLMQEGKQTKSFWMSSDNVLHDFKNHDKVLAKGLDEVYQFLSDLNQGIKFKTRAKTVKGIARAKARCEARANRTDAYNIYLIVHHVEVAKFLPEVEKSKTYIMRQQRYKTGINEGKGKFKPNGQWQTEYYDPATGGKYSGKTVEKIKSTSDKHIKSFDFVFTDKDNKPTGEQSNFCQVMDAPVTPSLIVQTSEAYKLQTSWRVDGIKDNKQYRDIQVALAHKFGGDTTVQNPARIVRVAGFDNASKKYPVPLPAKVLHAEHKEAIHIDEFIRLMELDLTVTEKRSKPVKKVPKVKAPSKSAVKSKAASVTSQAPSMNDVESLFDSCHYLSSNNEKIEAIEQVMSSNWIEGQRRTLTFISSKLLYKLGLTENQILEIVTKIAIANDDQELSYRLKTVHDVVSHYENRKGLLANEGNYREWITVSYSGINTLKANGKRKGNQEMKKASSSLLYTFFFYNQLENGYCGAVSYTKIEEHTGMKEEKLFNKLENLKDLGCLRKEEKEYKVGEAYIYHFTPLKNHSDYIVPIETKPSEDDLIQQRNTVDEHNVKRNDFREGIEQYQASQANDTELDQVTRASDFDDDLPPDDYVVPKSSPQHKGITKRLSQAMANEKVARSRANRKSKELRKTITVTQLDNDDDFWECLKDLRQKHNQDV